MASTLEKAISANRILPESIRFVDYTPVEQKAGWFWSVVSYPIQQIGLILRNALYLPYYSQANRAEDKDELDLANEFASKIKDAAIPLHSNKKIDAIRDNFSIRDVAVTIEQGQQLRQFTVRLFQSKTEILGKIILFILFSFYDNEETVLGTVRRWEPLTIRELSKAPLDILRALKAQGVEVDVLITQSLGNVTYDAIKELSKEDQKIIPRKLVINRGLASVLKVALKLYAFPLSLILYRLARISGWNADPEQDLVDFLEKNPQSFNGTKREVVIIEAKKDHFFSGPGGLGHDLHEKLTKSGVSTFRGEFCPAVYHSRANHAASLSKLTKNSVTKIFADDNLLNLQAEEKVTAALARYLLSKEGGHCTCLYVGGNRVTLDVGTRNDIAPLLIALIKENEQKSVKK